jgi:hypothetical protein
MRPLDIRCFDVRDGRVVADGVVPLAVEADLATGRVSGVWTWETAAGRRGRRVATDVVLTGGRGRNRAGDGQRRQPAGA